MKYLLPILLLSACAHKTDTEKLGKYLSTERVDLVCVEQDKQRCVTAKQIFEHGYVLMRRNGAVVSVTNN